MGYAIQGPAVSGNQVSAIFQDNGSISGRVFYDCGYVFVAGQGQRFGLEAVVDPKGMCYTDVGDWLHMQTERIYRDPNSTSMDLNDKYAVLMPGTPQADTLFDPEPLAVAVSGIALRFGDTYFTVAPADEGIAGRILRMYANRLNKCGRIVEQATLAEEL